MNKKSDILFWDNSVKKNKDISVIGFNAIPNYPLRKNIGDLDQVKHFFKPVKGKKILDIGCGWGRFLIKCAEKGMECYGFDFSPEMIKLGEKICERKDLNIKFSVNSIEEFKPAKTKFDFIWCYQVSIYLPPRKLKHLFKTIQENLAEDGIAYIEFRNRWNLIALLSTVSLAFKKHPDPSFRYSYSVPEIRFKLSKFKLKVINMFSESNILFPLFIPRDSIKAIFSIKKMPLKKGIRFIPIFPVFLTKLFMFIFKSLANLTKCGIKFPVLFSKEYVLKVVKKNE